MEVCSTAGQLYVHGDRLLVSVDVAMWYSLWQRTILGKGADGAAWLG